MKPLLPLLLLTAACVAGAQATPSAQQFGRSLRLPDGSFESARASALLGRSLPREGVRLLNLTPLGANYLKAAFTDAPARFGYRCSGEQEVTILPGTADDARALGAQLLQAPGTQPLSRTPQETLFRAGNVFARFTSSGGALYLAACRVTRDTTALLGRMAGLETYLGSTPSLVTSDLSGRLHWCTAAAPLRTVAAFSGSTLALDVSPDAALVAAAGWDAQPSVKVYDAATGTLRQTLGLPGSPLALTFSGDSKSLLVLDSDRTYTWLDLASGKVLKTWTANASPTPYLMGAGSSLFIQWGSTDPVRGYDAQTGRLRFSLRNFNLSAVTLTPDGKWVVTADRKGVLSAYSTQDGKPGPQASLGVLVGAGLAPGAGGSEVIALLRQNTEGKPSRMTTFAWKVGEAALTPRGSTEHRSGQAIVLNPARTQPASITPCALQE